ncbi:hypothetical protein TNCV_457351 [Trichonephila clavipes]|nr:hypothetical protein TNCV_457351 [Trichonephila clavipes]
MALYQRFRENRSCWKSSFTSISRSSRLNSYSNEELADMLIVCKAADCNRHANRQLYQESYPNRRISHYANFESVNKMGYESVSGYMNSLVYQSPAPSVDDLSARISVAAGRIRDISGIFEKLSNSMQCHC